MKKIFALIIMVIGIMLGSSGLAYATDLSTNLVTDGDGNNLSSWTVVKDSGYEDHWTVETAGGEPGYAPISPYDNAGGGNEYYDYWEIDGAASKNGQIYQDIPLDDTGGLYSKIDAGDIGLNAAAYIYKYLSGDTGELEIQFLNGANQPISVGPYQSSVGAEGDWEKVEVSNGAVPADARTIRVILTALLTTNNSFVDFDGIDVQLCNLPTISITDATANLTYRDGDTITISGTASDPDSAALTISAAINGHTATDSIPSGSGTWSLSWDITGLSIDPGDYSDIAITADNGQETRTETYTGTLTVIASHKTAAAAAELAGPGVGADNSITITVKDSAGNADTDFDGDKTVTITGYAAAPDATYGSFGGTALEADGSTNVTVNFTDGVGTANLTLNKAGARTIGLSVTGVDTPATNNLNITPVPGAAVAMQVTQDITAPAVNGENFAQQPQVTLKDQYGNICTNDDATVITVSKKDLGAWTLTGTSTAPANSGAVTFSGLGATNTAAVAGAQLAFNAGSLPEVTSTTVTLPAPAPHKTAAAAAASAGPGVGADNSITITVKDSAGNADTDFDGDKTVTITGYAAAPDATYGNFGGTALEADGSTNVTVNFMDGVGTANLTLNKAGAQTIGLSVAGVDTPATNNLNITPVPGAAVVMQVTQDITAPAVNGESFAQQPQVTLKDQYGNICTNDTTSVITVSRKDAGAWTLTGTLTATVSSGVATFSGLGATNTAQVLGAQLAFNTGTLPEVTSTTVTLPAPAPHKTAEAVAVSSGPIVGADNNITITVKDSAGNADVDFDGNKTVTITGYAAAPDATYGSFEGTSLIVLEADGSTDVTLSFTDGVGAASLKLHKAGARIIGLSVAGVDTPATNNLNITPVPGAAAAMQVTQDITAPAVNGGNFAQQPRVTLKDQYGNICTNDTTSVITVSKKDAGAWTLTGTLTATANSGAAAFSGLGATNTVAVAGAQLAFNTGTLPEVTSSPVNLPVPAPHVTATAEAATGGPTAGADNTITITVKNTLGNADTDFDGNKTVTITGYAAAPDATYGSFGGTALEADGSTNVPVSFTDGVGTASLRLNKAGARTIGLSVAGVDTPATNNLNITPVPGAAAAMQVTQDITAPAMNGGNFVQQPQVTLKDQYGNICTNDTTSVITVSKKDAGAWTLTGTLTATANSGAAAFSGLGATNTVAVAGAQLAFNTGTLPEVTSSTVNLPAPAPHKTAEAVAASSGPIVGADNTITITVKNTLGNTDADFDGNKTVTITGYTAAPDATCGSFEGTSLTVLEADGSTNVTVSFTDGVGTAKLKLNKADAQTIGLSVAGVDTPATNNLNITPVPGAAALMQVTQDITAPAANGGNFAQQPQVTLKDQYGNICTNDDATVITVSKKDAGAWTLTGTLAATANSGVVTFSGLGATNTVAVAGAQLAFDTTGLTQVTSTTVTLLAAAGSDDDSGGSNTSTQPAQTENSLIPSFLINTDADRSISNSLSASGEAMVLLGTATTGDKAQLTPAVVETLSKNDKSLTVERSGVEIKFAPDSLMTAEMNAALADTTAKVEIGVREIPAQEKIQILTQSKIGESTGLFEVGGKIFDLSAQIIQTASNQQTSSEKIKNFSEPVAVTIDLSGLTLSEEEIASLTGVRYEKAADGSISAVKLGGSYDSAAKTFTFYTDRFSLYGVLSAQEIKRISLQLGDNKLYVNGDQRTMDVIPEVVNNRTLVPISFIAEAMGAEVTWDNESSTVGIFLKEKKIHITIGETLPGMDTPPIIKNNRTFVPLRFVAETLGAQVLWFNSTQSIQITQ